MTDEISCPKELIHSDGVPGAGGEKVTLPSRMVDRVAQRIADLWDHTRDPVEMCDVFARAAIEEMRKPDMLMINSGRENVRLSTRFGNPADVYGIWEFMIRAALLDRQFGDRTVAPKDGTSE